MNVAFQVAGVADMGMLIGFISLSSLDHGTNHGH